MSSKTRHSIIFLFLTMSFIPFMLLTDLFPFMRFGMFSETVKQNPQKEFFSVTVQKKDGTMERLSVRQTAIDDVQLNYITRKYFYQNKIDLLVSILLNSGLLQKDEHLIITQKILSNRTWINKTIIDKK